MGHDESLADSDREISSSDRASRALDGSTTIEQLPDPTRSELRQAIAREIEQALEQYRAAVRDTLAICMAAFNEALAAGEIPGHVRASFRLCRGLCLDALGDDNESAPM